MTSDVSSRPSVLKKKPTPTRPSAISALPALLLLVGFLLIEPNLLASQLKQVGFGLIAASAVLAVLNDRGVISWAKSSPVVLIFTLLATFWVIFVDSNSRRPPIYSITDGFILFVCVIAAGVVLSNQRRLLYFTRGFVLIVTAVALSYVVTAGIWAAGAVGVGEIFKLPVGTWMATVFFPFTSTTGTQTFLGITLPRLAGIGREPGWMAMYGGVAFFLAPLVIASRRKLFWTRTLAIVAVLAPISTGGFVAFIIGAAYAFFLTKRPGASLGATFFRRAFGLIASAGAVWFVINAPVLGLNAKEGMNAVSLSERNFVTAEGLKALEAFSLGGPVDYPNSSLNLIAAVAPNGWPYLVLILAALLMPRIGHPLVSRSTAAIMVITITLLFSQPTGASSAVFILVIAIYAAAAMPPLPAPVQAAPVKAKTPRPLPRR